MTAPTEHGSDSGTMDIREHVKTWHGFLTFAKWMVIMNIAILAFLAIFRTHG